MTDKVTMAFRPNSVKIPIGRILPIKMLPAGTKHTTRYKRVRASMQEVGVIEPPIVFPQKEMRDSYLLLDGHVRLEVAKELGIEELLCLIATDDEAFTYNHKVNQISPIQEHYMIEKSIKGGLSEERIARALDVDPGNIRQKRRLLDGICPEAVELLKTRRIVASALKELKKVKPVRQVEMAEMMIAANNTAASYAKCMVVATPVDQLVESDKPKHVKGISTDDMSRMERELAMLERDFKTIEQSYGDNMLNLVVAVGYLRKLLDNAPVVRYLSRQHGEILAEFQKIVEAINSVEAQ